MGKEVKAQLSVFIIIALSIIVLGILFYIRNQRFKNQTSDFDRPGFENLKKSIVDCVKKSSKDSLIKIGLQGGYYKKPEKYLNISDFFVPYYYYEDNLLLPELTKIESELSYSMDENFLNCLKEIKIQNFEISYAKPKTKSFIEKEKIKFVIDLPISVKKDKKTTLLQLNTLPVTIDSSLYEIYELAKFISESLKKDDRYTCLSCIYEIAKERNLYVDIINFDSSSSVYIISENHTTSEFYYYQFLSKRKKLDDFIVNFPPLPPK